MTNKCRNLLDILWTACVIITMLHFETYGKEHDDKRCLHHMK